MKEYTISASIKPGGLNEKKTWDAFFHNERLGFVKSEIVEKKSYRFNNKKGLYFLINKDNRKERREYTRKYVDWHMKNIHKMNQEIVDNDPSNFDEKQKRRRKYSQFKHNIFTEIVVHVGKGGTKNLTTENITLANENIKKWLVEMGMRDTIYSMVVHLDEKGEGHLHAIVGASNAQTGKKKMLFKEELKRLQDMIHVGMKGFKRGDDWDEHPEKKRASLSVHDYKEQQEREKAQLAKETKLAEDNKALKKKNEELEAKYKEKEKELEAKYKEKEEKLAERFKELGWEHEENLSRLKFACDQWDDKLGKKMDAFNTITREQQTLEEAMSTSVGQGIMTFVLARAKEYTDAVDRHNLPKSFVKKLEAVMIVADNWHPRKDDNELALKKRDPAKALKALNTLNRVGKAVEREVKNDATTSWRTQ